MTVPGTPTKSGDDIAAAAAMPPPPTTPKRRGRRALPRTKTPAKPRTPKGGLTALRMGQGEDEEEGGKEGKGEGEGEEQEEEAKLTPSKDKLRGPSRTLEMVRGASCRYVVRWGRRVFCGWVRAWVRAYRFGITW